MYAVDTSSSDPTIVYKEQIMDTDDYTTYNAAIIVWSIFFVLIFLAVVGIFFLFKKARANLAVAVDDLTKLDLKLIKKREELAEVRVNLDKKKRNVRVNRDASRLNATPGGGMGEEGVTANGQELLAPGEVSDDL